MKINCNICISVTRIKCSIRYCLHSHHYSNHTFIYIIRQNFFLYGQNSLVIDSIYFYSAHNNFLHIGHSQTPLDVSILNFAAVIKEKCIFDANNKDRKQKSHWKDIVEKLGINLTPEKAKGRYTKALNKYKKYYRMYKRGEKFEWEYWDVFWEYYWFNDEIGDESEEEVKKPLIKNSSKIDNGCKNVEFSDSAYKGTKDAAKENTQNENSENKNEKTIKKFPMKFKPNFVKTQTQPIKKKEISVKSASQSCNIESYTKPSLSKNKEEKKEVGNEQKDLSLSEDNLKDYSEYLNRIKQNIAYNKMIQQKLSESEPSKSVELDRIVVKNLLNNYMQRFIVVEKKDNVKEETNMLSELQELNKNIKGLIEVLRNKFC